MDRQEDLLMNEAMRRPIVTVKDGEAFADSRDVAAFFAKNHFDVLRAIRNLIEKEPDLGRRNFAVFKIKDLTGETTSHYEMDRDGFTLLAMGFTGGKALRWKLDYIAAFNTMEAELRKPATAVLDYSDPQVLLGVLDHLQSKVKEQAAVIEGQVEKIKKLDRIEASVGSMCFTDAAKTLKVGRDYLIRFMQSRSWIYKRVGNTAWIGRQDKITAGYLEHREHVHPDSLGQERVSTRALITGKGLVKLSEMLNAPLH